MDQMTVAVLMTVHNRKSSTLKCLSLLYQRINRQGFEKQRQHRVFRRCKRSGQLPEKLHRALLVSNLITIHQKTSIGRLSAFCGATSAGVGAACGIAWLDGGGYEEISHTIVNALAVLSGMVCDGAKPSCAAKIAMAVNNGIFGYRLYRQGLQFYAGDGIVTKGVENTIANVGRLANRGMRMTDGEILDMMVGK